jgi:mRNA interferase MazF
VPYRHVDALEAGDVLWVDFGPPRGHEQAGRRPAIVVSPREYNELSSLILVCPITRNVGAWAFKVDVKGTAQIEGAVLVDHLRSIDRQVRFVRRVERVGQETLDQVRGVLATLFAIPVSN